MVLRHAELGVPPSYWKAMSQNFILMSIFKGNDAGDVREMGKRDLKESAGEELSSEFPDEGKK